MAENKDNQRDQKLYMKWWFWVIAGILFIFTISVFIPGSSCEDCEKDLNICNNDWDEYLDALEEYDEALVEYCEIDYTNPLCDILLSSD